MILDKIFPPDPRVENEAIELINKGHEVFLFCLTYTNQKKEEEVNQITVKRYKSNKLEYKLSALAYTIPLYSILMEKKISHFLSEARIEAIHIHDIVIAEAVFKANKKLGLLIVLDLHENRPEIMKFYPHLKRFPSNVLISPKKWKEKEESFIKKANRVIVVTKDAKEEIVERTKIDSSTISVVPNTVRSSFYEKAQIEIAENKKKDNFVLLYIGDTGERRGLKTVVRSLPKLAKGIKNIKLVIVGKVTNELKLEVDKLKITNYVDFQGWQNESTFVKYIQESDVCLSPLHRNIHHDTTYANKLFQYMSLGKPLIVSNATAQKKLVEEYNTGLVHKEKDVEDFENKVLELYNNPLLREQLGKNGKGFVQNEFTWDKTSKELINLYAGL